MTYNEIIQKAGKRIIKHVYYIANNTTTYVNDANVKSVKLSFQSSLVGTIMQGCELILKEPINGDVYVQIEAKYSSYTATKTYGPYSLKEEPTYNASDKSYTHYLYDNILLSMHEYEPITMTYPTTIYDFFAELVDKLGYTTNIDSLPNGSITMASDIYEGINYTYRDVLDDIAQANGVLFYIDGMELKIASLGTTPITINDRILKKQNIAFGEHFGPINVITLSRAGGSDNIYYPATLPETIHEFKISDNQLMNDNNRDVFLPAIYSQLNGIEYDIFDTELVGYGDITPLQQVTFTTGNNSYSSYVFNQEIVFTQGYKQSIYTEMPEETNTEYKYADTTDKRINQTQIIVDKQNNVIQSLVNNTTIVSDTKTGTGSVTLENAFEGQLYQLSIKGNINKLYPQNSVEYGHILVPNDNLTPSNTLIPSNPVPYGNEIHYPSSSLYPTNTILTIDETDYELDINCLNYMNNTTYDEFVYENGKCKIIRRVGIDSQGDMYALPSEVEEQRKDIILIVSSDSTITLSNYNNAILTTTYLLQNTITSNFATEAYVQSSITQTADSINLEVASKVDNEDYTGANILLKINQDESEAQINADKISLEGKKIRMTSDDVEIVSTNFNVDSDGNMTCNNATMTNANIVNGAINITQEQGSTVLPILLQQTVNNVLYSARIGAGGIRLQKNGTDIAELLGGGSPGKNGYINLTDTNGTSTIILQGSNGTIECQDLWVNGDLDVLGSKNRAIRINDNEFICLNAYETATPYFGDIGSSKTDENGYVKIDIENIFSQTIELDTYKVFIQKCGDGDLYVKKYDKYFEVLGTPNLDFDWEIKAIQKGYKGVRLQKKESDLYGISRISK